MITSTGMHSGFKGIQSHEFILDSDFEDIQRHDFILDSDFEGIRSHEFICEAEGWPFETEARIYSGLKLLVESLIWLNKQSKNDCLCKKKVGTKAQAKYLTILLQGNWTKNTCLLFKTLKHGSNVIINSFT